MKKILISSIVILAILVILSSFPEKPRTTAKFVTNRTIEVSEDWLFIRETTIYPSNVTIITQETSSNIPIGIVEDAWNINFGILPVGVNGKRFINVANYNQPMSKTRLVCHGSICPMITFDKNDFKLHKGDEVKISVHLNTSLSSAGDYSGEIHILSEIPKTSFISFLLDWL